MEQSDVFRQRREKARTLADRGVELYPNDFKVSHTVGDVAALIEKDGSLWFKSGTSKRKNYLQTPTAVCGLRGTTIDAVYNNVVFYVSLGAGTVKEDITLSGASELVPNAATLFEQLMPEQLATYSGIYRALDQASIQPDTTRLTLVATYMALDALLGNEHIPQGERDLLEKALELVRLELKGEPSAEERGESRDAVQRGLTDEQEQRIKEETGSQEWEHYLEEGSPSGHGPP
ncbi:MAG: hypothetical protein SWE60_27245 [Thermodesulfobacteriota bacterium]|nr:hypothetical protein [Thermodesulfobacteriota bacterium]